MMLEPMPRRVVAATGRDAGDKRSMPVLIADQIVLCDGQRRLLLARARRASGEHRDVLRAGSCWPPPTARRTPRSAEPWVSMTTPCVSGGAGSASTASTVLVIGPVPVGPAASRRR